MPVDADLSAPASPSFADPDAKGASAVTEPYIHPGTGSDDFLDIFDMTGNFGGMSSPSPYIKDEPDDRLFNVGHHRFPPPSHAHAHAHTHPAVMGLTDHPHHHHHHQHQNSMTSFGQSHGSDASVDPSELTMQGDSLSTQNGGGVNHGAPGAGGPFTAAYPSFGAPPHMSFNLANSGIADDELLDLGNLDDAHMRDDLFAPSTADHTNTTNTTTAARVRPAPHPLPERAHTMHAPASAMNDPLYSPQPDDMAMHSPFGPTSLPYDHFSASHSHQQPPPPPHLHHHMSATSYASPRPHGNMPVPMNSLDRRQMHAAAQARARGHPALERNNSGHSRSPLTPHTPGIGHMSLSLATPESGSFPQPIHAQAQRLAQARHQRTFSNHSSQWETAVGSVPSYGVDSPLSSPGGPATAHHAQISDVLRGGKPASLPAKVENGGGGGGMGSGSSGNGVPGPAFQTQEAKRRRRRESHNLVERRRRDNINERIQELSHLVPGHRLEDERVRKHLLNNSPLSPGLGALGVSPPAATSLLAGGAGRRAAGTITMGIPVEDKDKGPNKGDILNGSVSWTRDLMWALYAKYQQESELADYITTLGGTFPFEPTEEDRRMRTELLDAMEKNDASSFMYSRAPGSGLRVPKHTNLAGETLHGSHQGLSSPRSLSPANLSSGDSRNASVGGQMQFMSGDGGDPNGHHPMGFKEEDEYGMDMS
ncbi:MAG: hypothetical protein M1823_003831 [Watsoniomyces obsoletus]|nr:MAG: hypothetical protein M1823_003831 [Watsoniomyces obsoletus]